MNTATTSACPPVVDLDRLLRGRLTEAKSASLAEHVGACSGCQKRLELLAGEGDDLPSKLREAQKDQPPTDSAYWTALAKAEDEVRITTLTLNNGSADTHPSKD